MVLLAGTLGLALWLFGMRSSPYLTRLKRELLSDYALPIGVLVMAVLYNASFADVPMETFRVGPSCS